MFETKIESKRAARSDGPQGKTRPFLRWAGSKQRLLDKMLPLLPATYGRYYEPFLGSGALFFALQPRRATLSDASSELINAWKSVRDHSRDIARFLEPLKPSKEFFYELRRNRSADYPERAAEFLYLNKTCWNGLYRVNAKGEFNVPYGLPQTDFLFDRTNLFCCSRALSSRKVTIRSCDFEIALRSVRSGDLVFLDPPYVTKHNFNGFRDWNERLFRWEDQERLAIRANKLANKGAYVVVSNALHPDIVALYSDFSVTELERSSTLASDSSKRGRVKEALFRSF
ncbi:MAG: DNA adenine methylase [Rhizobiaceae bacterium]